MDWTVDTLYFSFISFVVKLKCDIFAAENKNVFVSGIEVRGRRD